MFILRIMNGGELADDQLSARIYKQNDMIGFELTQMQEWETEGGETIASLEIRAPDLVNFLVEYAPEVLIQAQAVIISRKSK